MPFRLDPDDRRCVQKQNEDGSWERLEDSPCHGSVEDAISRLNALRINVSSQESTTEQTLNESYSKGWFFSEAEVDRRENVIRNVKLLGRHSENGRIYSEQAMRDATGLYNGAPFYIDHPTEREMKERGGTRSVHDLAGKIRNPRMGHDEVRGDLHLLEREPHKSLVFGIAESMPDMAGMSHRAEGHLRRTEDGQDVVENLGTVHAVELVTEPATTNGLFESIRDESEEDEMSLDELTAETLREERPELVEQIRAEAEEEADVEDLRSQNRELREKVDELEAEKAERTHREMVAEKLAEADLPDRVITDTFRESLHGADSEEDVDALVADRKELVERLREAGPKSTGRDPDKLFEGSESDGPTADEIQAVFG